MRYPYALFAGHSASYDVPVAMRGCIAPNNSGTITIQCGGISSKLGNQLVAILNRIAKNQLDPDEVMAKLEEIQKGVNEIRENTAPRIISDDAAKAILTALSVYEGQRATMTYLSSDSDARKLCERIKGILDASGWIVEPPHPAMIIPSGPTPGIEVSARMQTPATDALLNVLDRVGLSIGRSFAPNIQPDVIRIIIFQKP
jgi:hypothetical protein